LEPRLPPPAKAPPANRPLRRRNRLLALLLGSVAVLGFVTVLSLAVLLHYAEAHHLLAGL
jgi:heme A synthase